MHSMTERLNYIRDLEEKHPDLPSPTVTIWGHHGGMDVSWHLDGLAGVPENLQREMFHRITRTLGGDWRELDLGANLCFTRSLIEGSMRVKHTIYLDYQVLSEEDSAYSDVTGDTHD